MSIRKTYCIYRKFFSKKTKHIPSQFFHVLYSLKTSKKPLVFCFFPGGIKSKYWPEMGR